MSSKMIGEYWWALELTATIRAFPAAARASCSERACRLHTDTGGRAGDDGSLPGRIDARGDLGRSGVEPKGVVMGPAVALKRG